MSSERVATVMAVVLSFSAFALAQSQSSQAPASSANKTQKQKPISSGADQVVTVVLPNGPAPVAVPDGEGAWSIQIDTGGGLTGTGADTVTMTSAGRFSCDGAKSSTGELPAPELAGLSPRVAAVRFAHPVDQLSPRPVSVCSDCYNTTLTLSRREKHHQVKTYITTWDTVTRAQVPKDLQHLYESVVKLAACQ